MHDTFIRFACTLCGRGCKAPPDYAGRTVRCAACGEKLRVPGETIEFTEEQPSAAAELPVEFSSQFQYDDSDSEGISSPWYGWPFLAAVLFGGSLVVIVLAILVIEASPQTRAYLAAGLASLMAYGLVVWLVAHVKQCSIGAAIGFTLLTVGIAIASLLVVFLAVASMFGRSTLRPQNFCSACGHTWYPRGSDYSPRCPNCGQRR